MQKGFINIDNHNIHFEFINHHLLTANKSHLLIFLHHGVGSIRQWGDFPRKLCNTLHMPALLYDRYGYGMSDPLTEKRNSDYLTHEGQKVLPQLIQSLNINTKIILIGHSDGGSIALAYAALPPANLSAFVTIAPHVLLEDISISGIKNAVTDYNSNSTLKNGLIKYHGSKADSMFFGWADVWLNEKFRQWNIIPMLHNIKAPLLAIQGDHDEYGTILQLTTIQQQLSSPINIQIIPDCAHSPHLTHQSQVINLISQFINKQLKINDNLNKE